MSLPVLENQPRLTNVIVGERNRVRLSPKCTSIPFQSKVLSEVKSDMRVRNPQEWQAEMNEIQKALESTPEDDTSYPEILTRRGLCLTTRFGGMGPMDIQTALDHLEKARGLMAQDDGLLAPNLAGTALCFFYKALHFGQLRDLDTAIANLEKVLKILPDRDPDLGEYIAMLSGQILLRHHRTGNLEDLELAIDLDHKAITLAGKDNEALFMLFSTAGVNLVARYDRLGDLADVQLAVKHFEAATNLTPDSHPAKLGQLLGLAGAYTTMFTRLGDLRDIDSSIHHLRTGLKLVSDGLPSVPFWDMLAMSLAHRSERSGNLDDLELAMEAAEKVQKLVPAEGPPASVAHSHYLMGTILIWKYKALHKEDDLQRAIYNHQVALRLLQEGDPQRVQSEYSLAQLLGFRYKISQNPEDLNSAFSKYRDALQLASFRVSDGWIAVSRWLSLAKEHDPEEVLRAYKAMFSLLPATFWVGNSLSARQGEIGRVDMAQRSSDAIAACIDHHDLTLAVEFFEQGLATTFQQMQQLRPDLSKLPEADATRLHDMSLQLYTGTAENANRLATERNQLLAEIRKQPDFEYFLLPQPYQILSKAAASGPILILNANKDHCDCIIILTTRSNPLHVALPEVTLDRLQHHKRTLQNLLGICNVRSRDADSTRLFCREGTFPQSISVKDSFENILAWLWKAVVGPIYQALRDNRIFDGRVWWCPTGAFAGLPLHAAAPSESDQFICSYTATIGALLNARRLPVSESPKLGLVGVTHSGQGQLAALPGVRKEIEIVSEVAGTHLTQSLVGDKATVVTVTSQLQTCEWVHLACHGKQDAHDPPKSCLQLYEGDLDLETIMKMPLSQAEFVFLAACQTAMGDAQLVNESFHLGGGLIAAGFRGSIGTLWSMQDSDGPRVAETVYSYLFRKGTTPKATDAAKALQLAVRKMRDEGVPYQRWVPFIHMGI